MSEEEPSIPWGRIPKALVNHLASFANLTQARVYFAIATCADADFTAYPSAGWIAKRVGCTDRTVRRAVAAMVTAGLLSREVSGGRGLRQVYTLRNPDAVDVRVSSGNPDAVGVMVSSGNPDIQAHKPGHLDVQTRTTDPANPDTGGVTRTEEQEEQQQQAAAAAGSSSLGDRTGPKPDAAEDPIIRDALILAGVNEPKQTKLAQRFSRAARAPGWTPAALVDKIRKLADSHRESSAGGGVLTASLDTLAGQAEVHLRQREAAGAAGVVAPARPLPQAGGPAGGAAGVAPAPSSAQAPPATPEERRAGLAAMKAALRPAKAFASAGAGSPIPGRETVPSPDPTQEPTP